MILQRKGWGYVGYITEDGSHYIAIDGTEIEQVVEGRVVFRTSKDWDMLSALRFIRGQSRNDGIQFRWEDTRGLAELIVI